MTTPSQRIAAAIITAVALSFLAPGSIGCAASSEQDSYATNGGNYGPTGQDASNTGEDASKTGQDGGNTGDVGSTSSFECSRFIDDDETGADGIAYSGTWASSTGAGKYGGTDHYADSAGASGSFTWVGGEDTSIVVHSAMAAHHGQMGVSIDGATEVVVDLYASTRTEDVAVHSSSPLAAGKHTITWRWTGANNASSSGTVITIDRLDVDRIDCSKADAGTTDADAGTLDTGTPDAGNEIPPSLAILPVGDSNTENVVGYRQRLKDLLAAKGIGSDLLGSQTSDPAKMTDPQHEGYPGEGINKIQQRVNEGMIEAYPADFLLLLIGSNDMWISLADRQPIDQAKAEYWVSRLGQLLDDIASRRPTLHVIVAKPVTPGNTPAPLAIYRAGIDTLVASRQAQGVRISSVDLTGAANDGVHYTQTGYEVVASRWYAEILQVLGL